MPKVADELVSGAAEDPALAAVRTWRALDAERAKALARWGEVQTAFFAHPLTVSGKAYDAAEAASDLAFDRHWAALGRLYQTVPTTHAGAIEMLTVIVESDEGCLSHPGIADGIRNALACLLAQAGEEVVEPTQGLARSAS